MYLTLAKNKYIQRIDNDDKSAHHWVVNIQVDGKRFNRCFCDKKLGGKSSAMLAAIAYRGLITREYGLLLDHSLPKQPAVKDAKGVCLTTKSDGTYSYEIYKCYWHETIKGKRVRRTKVFSVNKWGKRTAKRLAREHRESKLKELYY